MDPNRADGELAGRVALVTGGGRGIGRAIALTLGRMGATVAVNYRRDEHAALDTVAAIETTGGHGRAFQASIDDLSDVERLVAAVEDELGPTSILVNNAGTASHTELVADCSLDEVVKLWHINTLGPMRLCQLVLPHMRAQPRGDIVMISSMATTIWAANSAPYNIAKAGMEALAYTLAKEESRHHIRVNVVAPGLVATDMGTRLVQAHLKGASIAELDPTAPFGRVCRPDDVAGVVGFLVSPAGEYITGERIRVDGGKPGLSSHRGSRTSRPS